MKLVKSLMLSSAAGIVAMSGAQAADLPIKAKAVEYVRICSLYGAGFYYIPGTDTCLKIGGYLRADIVLNSNNDSVGNTALPSSAFNRMTNAFTWRGRQDLDVDTRTATEYGVVRTFASMTFTWTSDSYAITPSGSTVYSPIGPSPFGSAPNNANGGAVAGGTLGVYYAFIQFAGFTIGKAISQFSAPWTNYPGNNFDGLVGGGGDVTGVNQVSYTWDFGQGVSAAISAQDPTAYYQAGNANLGTITVNGTGGTVITQNNGPFGASATANTVAPDIVGMARWDSTWGMIQFSAAAHDNHAAYFQSALLAPVPIGGATISGTELAGHPEDKWGWAAQLALSWKNIPTGAGDTINVQGVYTDGATRYNIQDLAGAAGANQIYGGTSLLGAYQSVGLGIAPDTVFHNGGEQQLIKTWGMRGAFNHNWDPYWSSSLYGAYAAVSYNDNAKLDLCGIPGVRNGVVQNALAPTGSGAHIIVCNPDYNIGQIGFITRWTPVKNLTFSADVTYTMLDQKSVGTIVLPASTVGKPSALYELKDENTWTALLRAQRNF